MIRVAIVLALLGLAGCSGDKAAPIPGGAWHVLNAGQWDLDPALVSPPDMPKAPK